MLKITVNPCLKTKQEIGSTIKKHYSTTGKYRESKHKLPVIIEHPKSCHKLSQTTNQAEKFSQQMVLTKNWNKKIYIH